MCKCLWRPEEDFGYPVARVSGSYELPNMGTELPLEEQ